MKVVINNSLPWCTAFCADYLLELFFFAFQRLMLTDITCHHLPLMAVSKASQSLPLTWCLGVQEYILTGRLVKDSSVFRGLRGSVESMAGKQASGPALHIRVRISKLHNHSSAQ